MEATAELLKKALKVHSAAEWERVLNLSTNQMQVAKSHGRLSPVIAGGIAMELGENAEHWIAVAAIENSKASKARDALMKRLRHRDKP